MNLAELEAYLEENAADKKKPSAAIGKIIGGIANTFAGAGGGINTLNGTSPLKHPAFKTLKNALAKDRGRDDFVSRLFYYINLKGKTHPEVYNAAGMTPDCFSKIISGKTKTPKKENVVALAIALGLDMEEATDLLSAAGHSLYKEKVDLIYRFCFENGPFTIDEVNEALVHFGCKAIGGR